jgi:hypothetical protein
VKSCSHRRVRSGLRATASGRAPHGSGVATLAAGAYAIALVFRVLDPEVCSAFPIGTHFLWHSFTGLAAYLAMRSLILNRAAQVTNDGTVPQIAPDENSERRAA